MWIRSELVKGSNLNWNIPGEGLLNPLAWPCLGSHMMGAVTQIFLFPLHLKAQQETG